MLKSYLKIAWRVLYKNKVYSAINIAGLTMTLVSSIFIAAYFENEINYDGYHEKKDRIYRLDVTFKQGDQTERFDITAHGLRDLLKGDFPEIEEIVRFYQMDGNLSIENLDGKKLFKENNFYYVDKEVFQVFTHPMISGNPTTALDGIYKIVLSEQLAQKYFGLDEALGKSLDINGKRYVVSGIMENVPKNSHLYFDAVLSIPPEHKNLEVLSFQPMNYLLFKPTFDLHSFREKLTVFDENIFLPLAKESWGGDEFHVAHGINLLVETHFITDIQTDLAVSPKSNIYIFPLVGLLLLFIVSMNTANLSISHGLQRNQDVAIRKINGASKSQILLLFTFEAMILALVSLTIALTLQQVLQSWFYVVIGKDIAIKPFIVGYVLSSVTAILLIQIATSTLSRYFLVKSKPNLLLRKQTNLGDSSSFKKGIMAMQFAISLLVVIGALIAYQQFTFMKSADLGFKSEQILIINIPGVMGSREKVGILKEALKKYPEINKISLGHVPLDAQMVNSYNKYGEKNVSLIKGQHGDENYIDLLGLEIIRGSNFSKEIDPQKIETKHIIINQSFAKVLGWENPIGQKIEYDNDGPAEIIGVVEDYHFRSLHHKIEPLLIIYNRTKSWHLLVRKVHGDVKNIEDEWYKVYPDKPFEYRYLDVELNNLYQQEASINQLLWYFSLLIISLTCFGLYGISFYTIVRRTKEIGIRKILGATFNNLIYLLSKDFLKLIGIALIIAIPASVAITQRWIEQYAYRIELEWYLFLIPTILLLFIAMMTMSFQTLKTAKANPVEALRYE